MLYAEFFLKGLLYCKCFIFYILNNPVVTSVFARVLSVSVCGIAWGLVSRSRLWEPVVLFLARDARAVVLGLSGFYLRI